MNSLKVLLFGKSLKRIFRITVSLSLLVTLVPLSAEGAAVESTELSIITDYQPAINEVIDESGFKHPGVGLTKDILENIRTQVRAQKNPGSLIIIRCFSLRQLQERSLPTIRVVRIR